MLMKNIFLQKTNNVLTTKDNALFQLYCARKEYLEMSLLDFAKKINTSGKKYTQVNTEYIVRIIPTLNRSPDGSNEEEWCKRQCILNLPFYGSYENLKILINAPMRKTTKWERVYSFNNLNISEFEVPPSINSDETPQPSDSGIR